MATTRIFLPKNPDAPTNDEVSKINRLLNKMLVDRDVSYDYLANWSLDFINDILNEFNLKQKDVGEVVGITASTISKLMSKLLGEKALVNCLSKLIPCYCTKFFSEKDDKSKEVELIRELRNTPLSVDRNINIEAINSEEKPAFFVCYRWKYNNLAISFLEIYSENKVDYSIYKIPKDTTNKNIEVEYVQSGTARFIGENLQIDVRKDNFFSTTILFVIGSADQTVSDIVKNNVKLVDKLYIGSYLTTSAKGKPTVGNMVFRQVKDRVEAINIYIKYHNTNRVRSESYNKDLLLKIRDYVKDLKDRDSVSDHIYTFLHNRRLSTDIFNLPRLEEPIPFMHNSKHMFSAFPGIYNVYYLHPSEGIWKRMICQIFPSGQSNLIERKEGDKINIISGSFRYTTNGKAKLMIGKFAYVEETRFYRFSIVLEIGEQTEGSLETFNGYFIYTGTQDYPSNGKMKFVQKTRDYFRVANSLDNLDNDNLHQNYQSFIAGGIDTTKYSKIIGPIARFAGDYECYALSSSQMRNKTEGKKDVVEMFPMKIGEDGKVQLKSRNSTYVGQASLINGFLSIVLTQTLDSPSIWRHLLFRVDGFSHYDIKHVVGVSSRNNQNGHVRSGIEILVPSQYYFDYNFTGFMDCIDLLFCGYSDKLVIINNSEYRISDVEERFKERESFIKAVCKFLKDKYFATQEVDLWMSKRFNDIIREVDPNCDLIR